MKIYTRTGDTGSTGLFGGPRVGKDDSRIEAYGTVDELNATIGMARCGGISDGIDQELQQIQHELFSIGAELATPDPDAFDLRVIGSRHIAQLEQWIDQHEATLEPLKHFILPGGTAAAAHLHLARSVCRRAERRVVTLAQQQVDHRSDQEASRDVESDTTGDISDALIIYLNRLSDYLFVLSRAVNHQAGVVEVQWIRP